MNDTRRPADHRPVRPARLPGLRRPVRRRPRSAYVAQMQEAGIPVTFGYISDAHDQHGVAGEIHATRGPGRGRLRPAAAGLRRRLRRVLQPAGRRRDQQEQHAVRRSPSTRATTSPARSRRRPGCDGVDRRRATTASSARSTATCRAARDPAGDHDAVHGPLGHGADVYLTGNPARTDPATRDVRAGRRRSCTASNPYTGHGRATSRAALADPVEDEDAAHGHRRSAADADVHAVRAPRLLPVRDRRRRTAATPCITVPDDAADEHVRVEPRRHPGRDRARRGLGIVGPGVTQPRRRPTTWTDHTDLRPTMLTCVGLEDDYVHDGRVVIEQLDASGACRRRCAAHRETLRRLGERLQAAQRAVRRRSR